MKITVNDATYWYEVHGKGTPLVLLHGFTGSRETWTPFIERWSSIFQLITIDLPGHGKTKTETPKTMEAFCADLSLILDGLQLSSVHVLGYSMGGRTALSFAMLYPKRVKSLILESASPGLRAKKERDARVANDEKLAERIKRDGLTVFIDFWESIPLFHTQKQLPEEVQRAIRKERLSQTEEGLMESLKFMGTGTQPSWWEQLSTLSIPVLLITGEQDLKFISINEQMAESLPNSQMKVISNAGHAIHVEQTDIFGKIVEDFLLAWV